jgi:hypothetical protein
VEGINMTYNIDVGRTDLRWLDASGKEGSERVKGSYLFRSATTDEAQRTIEEHGFDGSYIRNLSTGHAETQWINLAMLCLAQKYDGVVGITLEGLGKDPFARYVIGGYPQGRILQEVLDCPEAFRVSTEEGVEMPDFTNYGGLDTFEGYLDDDMKFVPMKKDKPANKQAERIGRNVYVELQPEFVAKLGSVNMEHGSFHMPSYRKMVKCEHTPVLRQPTLREMIRSLLPW